MTEDTEARFYRQPCSRRRRSGEPVKQFELWHRMEHRHRWLPKEPGLPLVCPRHSPRLDHLPMRYTMRMMKRLMPSSDPLCVLLSISLSRTHARTREEFSPVVSLSSLRVFRLAPVHSHSSLALHSPPPDSPSPLLCPQEKTTLTHSLSSTLNKHTSHFL